MKKTARFLVHIFLLISMLACITVSVQASEKDSLTVGINGNFDYKKASQVLTYTNKLRTRVGAPALKADAELTKAAMQRAAELQLIFSHTRPDGFPFYTVSGKASAENIAIGQPSPSSAFNCWKDSSGHYANMVNSAYRSVGIGCFYQGDIVCWVQLFGAEKASGKIPAGKIKRTADIELHKVLFEMYGGLMGDSSAIKNDTMEKGKTAEIRLGFFSDYSGMETFSYGGYVPFLTWDHFSIVSRNPDILSVRGGKLTAKKKGSARLIISHTSESDIKYEVSLTVKDSYSRTVKLNANGGSFSKDKSVKTKTLSLTYNKKYGNLPTPVRKGYTFRGWYTKKSGGSKIKSSSKVKTAKGKTQTLYAHWKKVTVSKVSLTSASAQKGRKLTVKWKKASGVKGYEIVLSTSSKFTKASTTKLLLKGSSKKSYVFSNLIKGKKYYVKVRAYKTDSCGSNVFGKYSKTKSVKIR